MRATALFRCTDPSTDSVSVGDQQLEHRGDGIFAVPHHLLAEVRSTLQWLLVFVGLEDDQTQVLHASPDEPETPPAPVSEEPSVPEAPGESAPKRSRG